jgi:glyoxylase-like metal-dependent hydrolase (beta-lactamase superfamily II)
MERVADGVHRIHSHGLVNWYLVEDGKRLAAVDAGFPPDWEALRAALDTLGHDLLRLEAVVLTHGHIDHIGFAERARKEAGATVYVHPRDERIVRRRASIARSERNPLRYLRNPPARRLFFVSLRTAAFRGKGVGELATFAGSDADALAHVPGSPRPVFTPGHTDGHCVLHLPDRDVLFTGDALVTRDPYTGLVGPRLVARAATADVGEAHRSLSRIAETGAGLLLPGHGEPWPGGAADAAAQAEAAGAA